MPEVYNWQLGRKMLYPYEERHPKWQFAFVFNINRCLACQTCSMADKSTWLFSKGQEYMWWNNVETKPYGGYPQFYGPTRTFHTWPPGFTCSMSWVIFTS